MSISLPLKGPSQIGLRISIKSKKEQNKTKQKSNANMYEAHLTFNGLLTYHVIAINKVA